MASQSVVLLENIHKHYVSDGADVYALNNINLSIHSGEFLAIMGPSGSGKSTLMNILGCLDLPDEGTFQLNGQDIMTMTHDELATIRNNDLGFVFQGFNLLPRTSALENVETPLLYNGTSKKERYTRAMEMLEQVGLGDRAKHLPNQLSGGQQQRIAIARALVNRPSLLLADEPTGNLDTHSSGEIMNMLTRLNKDEGLTIILITHEADVAAKAHRQLVMRDGRLG